MSDVVVIGAGIVGLSTAVAAALGGASSVLCLDANGVANPTWASGDGLRLFRVSYFEQPAYVPLLRRAIEEWKALGDGLYVPVGGFYAGPPESELIWGALLSAHQHDIPHDEMTAQESMRRFPNFRFPESYSGFFEPEAGFVRAARATRAMAAKAEKLGIRIENGEVLGVEPMGNRWEVRCRDRIVTADQVIVAAGNGTAELVPRVRGLLTRQTHLLTWFQPLVESWRESPGFGIMNEDGEMMYGFPAVDDVPGVKIGGHHRFSSDTLIAQEVGLRSLARQHLVGLSEEILSSRTCDYDVSPDGNFLIGPIEPGLAVACGFSGHGFKFGSVIGDVIWQAATSGLPSELSFLDVNRFTSTSGLT